MRSTLDRLVSWLGLALALVLAVASGLCFWASSFVADQVHGQLAAQKITMPSGPQLDDPKIKPYLEKYAGQQLLTGPQAEAFANHYISVHMDKQSGGRTYEEVSGEYMKLVKDPTADKAKVAELGQLRQSLFMGNTLRGLLLYGYAFATIGTIAGYAGWAAALGSLAMLALALLGLRHAKKAADAERHVVLDGPGATAARA